MEYRVKEMKYTGHGRQGEIVHLPRFFDPTSPAMGAVEHEQLFAVETTGLVEVDEFHSMLEASVPREVRDQIDHVLEEAQRLYSIGLAAECPADLVNWRRTLIQTWCHSRDMTVIMHALGYPKVCTGIHDIEEYALSKHVKKTARPDTSEWYQRWCATLEDDTSVNIGYWNPHLCASLCNWGSDKFGAQDAMHAHRLSEHHLGNPDTTPDVVEHGVNFVVHHLPREHFGVRHLPLGDWVDLNSAIEHTPLMQVSTIEQQIAADAAAVLQALEKEGKVTPWQLLKV
jgi:hypothetical protein